MVKNKQALIIEYLLIMLGSTLYAVSTVLFIFPHSLLLGGTSGISVILTFFLTFSPASIRMIINFLLILVAFVVLGKDMGLKTFVGSTLTTVFVGVFEKILQFNEPIISNPHLSAVIGAVIIAIASGLLSNWVILLSSFLGLLVKTLGIDLVISQIAKLKNRKEEKHNNV